MKDRERFMEAARRQIFDVWKLSAQADSVLEALGLLYDSIANRSAVAKAMFKADLATTVACQYQVQQTIYLTPLRFFLETLAVDSSLAIKAAAKALLCFEGDTRWDDEDARLMYNVNAVAQKSPNDAKNLLAEIGQSDLVKRAFDLWQSEDFGVTFHNPKIGLLVNQE